MEFWMVFGDRAGNASRLPSGGSAAWDAWMYFSNIDDKSDRTRSDLGSKVEE
jgi:hypothetical protein